MNSSRAADAADASAGAPAGWWAGGGAAVTVALPVLLAGVGAVSASGNLLLLAALVQALRRGQLPPAPALLLLSLCAADLLLALYCLPARAATYARRAWPLGAFVCRTTDWLLQGCLVAKGLSWAAVGRARYRHVASPDQGPPRRPAGWRGPAATVAAAWAAALLLPLPHLLFARLEAGGRGCAFAAPAGARRFVEVFGKLYPLLAGLAPSGFACWCAWRALRVQRARPPKSRHLARGGPAVTRRLLALALLFHAMWLPEWVVWLWERHGAPAPPPRPPPAALGFAAELLLFLNGALCPALLLAASEELRHGLRSVWRWNCATGPDGAGQDKPDGERPAARRQLQGEEEAAAAAEKVLPDVEHFWKDRRNTVAGEESDPIPWEHQGDP